MTSSLAALQMGGILILDLFTGPILCQSRSKSQKPLKCGARMNPSSERLGTSSAGSISVDLQFLLRNAWSLLYRPAFENFGAASQTSQTPQTSWLSEALASDPMSWHTGFSFQGLNTAETKNENPVCQDMGYRRQVVYDAGGREGLAEVREREGGGGEAGRGGGEAGGGGEIGRGGEIRGRGEIRGEGLVGGGG